MINVTVTVKSSLKVIRAVDFVCWDSGGLLFTPIQKKLHILCVIINKKNSDKTLVFRDLSLV